jgi:hypothetical protein
MSELTDAESSDIAHALGVSIKYRKSRGPVRQHRWSCRNYFAAGESADPLWDGLVKRGFAVRNSRHRSVYHVTQQGVRAAKLTLYVKALQSLPIGKVEDASQ